jgi:hypothetical protein
MRAVSVYPLLFVANPAQRRVWKRALRLMTTLRAHIRFYPLPILLSAGMM